MCGRYVRRGDKHKIAEWFHADLRPAELAMPDADYNSAPTTHQPIIRQSRETGERDVVLARWGLVPFFDEGDEGHPGTVSTINARAETITSAKTWRELVKKRRCLIPANAFHKWPKEGKPATLLYAFVLASGTAFAFAGIRDGWKTHRDTSFSRLPS